MSSKLGGALSYEVFFFSSGSQGLEVAEEVMWTKLGGLGKIPYKQHCSSKSSPKRCTSVCPYKTNRTWTPLMCLRNKLFSNKCSYNYSGEEGRGQQRKWASAAPICWGSLEEEWEEEEVHSCVWWKRGRAFSKDGARRGSGRVPYSRLPRRMPNHPGRGLLLLAFAGWSKDNSMRHSTEL